MFFRVYLQGEEDIDELIYSAQDSSIVGVSDNGDIIEISSSDEQENLPSPITISDSDQSILLPSIPSTELERTVTARPYRCGKCGQIKKGHTCPVVDGLTPPRPDQIRAPRLASKPGNLTRLAQRVDEGDNLADPDFVPALRTSPRLSEKRTRRLTSAVLDETEKEPSSKKRKVYECQRCKVPKKGHKCPNTSSNDVTVRQLCETPLIILNRVDC